MTNYCPDCDGRLIVGPESVRLPASEYCHCVVDEPEREEEENMAETIPIPEGLSVRGLDLGLGADSVTIHVLTRGHALYHHHNGACDTPGCYPETLAEALALADRMLRANRAAIRGPVNVDADGRPVEVSL